MFIPRADEHPRTVGNGWFEGSILYFIFVDGLFRFLCSLYIVLTEPVDNISLKSALFCNHLVELLTGWTNDRFYSIKFRLLHIVLYLLLVESMRLEVVILVEAITDGICLLLTENSLIHLHFQKLFVLPLICLLFLSKLLLPLLLEVRLSLFHDVLGALIDWRFWVTLVQKERMGILHPVFDSFLQLIVHYSCLLLQHLFLPLTSNINTRNCSFRWGMRDYFLR